jgi:hypothetical protein
MNTINSNVKRILKIARDIISKPENWCRFNLAQYHQGVWSYCAVGAIDKALQDLEMDIFRYDVFEALQASMKSNSISEWNDKPNRKHSDVLAAFDSAIASL